MLQGIFSGIGPISEVKVIKDKVSNKSAGYGFVKFLDPQVAELAMQQINRRVLFNQVRRRRAASQLACARRGCVRRTQRASAAMCTWCALDFRLPAASARPPGARGGPPSNFSQILGFFLGARPCVSPRRVAQCAASTPSSPGPGSHRWAAATCPAAPDSIHAPLGLRRCLTTPSPGRGATRHPVNAHTWCSHSRGAAPQEAPAAPPPLRRYMPAPARVCRLPRQPPGAA